MNHRICRALADRQVRPTTRPLVISQVEQKREELERVMALAGAAEHPIFVAVISYADEHARNEHEAALAANLSNEVRQFNAGGRRRRMTLQLRCGRFRPGGGADGKDEGVALKRFGKFASPSE